MVWEERWHPLRREWVVISSHRERSPRYAGVFAFDNDHPCVGPSAPDPVSVADGPYRSRRADGLSRVVCYSPRHDLSLAELTPNDVVSLLSALQEQFCELAARSEVRHVLMFENKGDVVGVSNPHPHCQIYATNFVFRTIEVEAEASAAHLADTDNLWRMSFPYRAGASS